MARSVALLAFVAGCSTSRPVVQAPEPSRELAARRDARIDAVMEPWANEDTPGCAVAVVQERELVFAKGYGMADLAHGVPITPKTVFDIGSTSKQFTATAVLLAEAQGKLALDDDIRAHVPALPQLGARPTTLEHLLHHTGGLRDYVALLLLGGHRIDGLATTRETLDMLSRQRGRDFDPGTRFAYSNTGYFLLGQAVEHATGRTLGTMLHEEVFEPLDMLSTQVLDDRTRIVPERATGYTPRGGGWRIEMSGWEQTGPGAVMSTVVDLAKWDANYYEPKVGGPALIDGLEARGHLADGTRLDYAAGLFHGSYRGQPTVWHAGGWAGYRAQFERFVGLETSIIVLCNATTARPDLYAHAIADIVLEDRLAETSTDDEGAIFHASRPRVELERAQLDAWTAMYREVFTGELMAVERTGGDLELVTMGERIPVVPTSPRTFQIDEDAVVLAFDDTDAGRTLVLRGPASEESYVEVELLHPSSHELRTLTGRYHSDELGTGWDIELIDGALVLTGPVLEEPTELVTAVPDEYSTLAFGGTFRFTRDERGDVTGFELDVNSMRGIRFERIR